MTKLRLNPDYILVKKPQNTMCPPPYWVCFAVCGTSVLLKENGTIKKDDLKIHKTIQLAETWAQ